MHLVGPSPWDVLQLVLTELFIVMIACGVFIAAYLAKEEDE